MAWGEDNRQDVNDMIKTNDWLLDVESWWVVIGRKWQCENYLLEFINKIN